MLINQILSQRGITKYRLSKSSGVPQTTINDICSGKAHIEKCSAETIYRISKVLNIAMEDLVEPGMQKDGKIEYHIAFETFKSNICHQVKDSGDLNFIIHILETNEIRKLFDRKWYPEALYLLAMVDYLSLQNEIPLCTNYDDIRASKLKTTLFPASVIAASTAMKSDKLKVESCAAAIPEFMRFNIVESEVRNVV